jgi:hypothetical protein
MASLVGSQVAWVISGPALTTQRCRPQNPRRSGRRRPAALAGTDHELNPSCGHRLARSSGGTCTVLTLGPASAGVGSGVPPDEYPGRARWPGSWGPNLPPPARSPTGDGHRGRARWASSVGASVLGSYVALGLSGKFNHRSAGPPALSWR